MKRYVEFARAVALLLPLLGSSPALALPEFGRKTGMSCSACHDAWPRLNDFGEAYRDRGYRLANTNDDVMGHPLDSFPASFRTTPGYQFKSTTNQPTDQGTANIHTGSFQFPSADIYVGGAVSNHVSTYVDIAGFSKDATASIESGWVRYNDVLTDWLNIKVGKAELDLPSSMHRAFTIVAPFIIYKYHPNGSSNPYAIAENQLAMEVSGHSSTPGFRYSVALASSNDLASSAWMSAPLAYSHVTQTFQVRSQAISRIRVGAMGDVGWAPTKFATLTSPSGVTAQVSGTGSANVAHGHAGGDVQVTLLSMQHPVTLTSVWLYGQEDGGLIPGGTRAARFHGGFAQVDYIPALPLVVGARYDGAYNLQQADPTQPANSNEQESFTLFARYALWLSPWGSAAVHFETGTSNTQNAGVEPGSAVRGSFVFAGVDFLL
jgi:hypothetical protein